MCISALKECGWRREHKDHEGRSLAKKDGSAAYQGGWAPMRRRMGWHDGVSSRAVALWRASAMVAWSCSTGVSREVREADQLMKKWGVGSAHWKWMAR
jgi:hypothetical protein